MGSRTAQRQRMCVTCRKRALSFDLLRVAIRAGRWVVDPRQFGDGRTAYVCPTAQCLDGGLRKQRLQRNLKSTAEDTTAQKMLFAAESVEKSILGQILDGAKRGRLVDEAGCPVSPRTPVSLEGRITRSRKRLEAIGSELASVTRTETRRRVS